MLVLPKVSSKSRKVIGEVRFNRATSRNELFPQKTEQPNYYQPNYDAVRPKRSTSIIKALPKNS